MRKGIFAICSVLLVLVVSIAVLIPGCCGPAPTQCTIAVKATLDGSPWTGAVLYTLDGPGATAPLHPDYASVPVTHSNVDCGNWTCAYVSGGPDGAYLDSITPSPTQSVSKGSTITFTLNFKTLAKIAAHFMTPEGEPYPFDVTISDGTWRKEFNNVTAIDTEVPTDATYTYVQDWDGHRLMNQFKLSLLPGERREFEIYSVNPAQSIERTRPYLLFQEVGANTSLSWNWDSTTNNLTVSVVSEPNKIVDVGVFVDTNDREQPNYVLAQTQTGGTTENKWSWAVCLVIWVDYQFCSNGMISLSFSEIEPDEEVVGFREPLFNGAIIDTFTTNTTTNTTRFNSILRDVNGALYDMEYVYPQYAVSPGSYILQPQGLPEEYAELKLPLNLQIGKPAILDLYPPKIADIEPFTFSVAAEYFFAHSSYSNLTYDEDTNTLSVGVSTETDYDWWGCFVLPDTATVAAARLYEGGTWHDLAELYDYTINRVDGYNIVVVRITPETEQLMLQYAATSCVLDLTNNTLSPTNSVVTPVEQLGDGKAVVEIDMGAGNSSVLEMKIEIQDPSGDWLLNIGNSPTNDGAGGDAGQFANDSELDVTSSDTYPDFILQLYANQYFSTPGAVVANLVPLFPPSGNVTTWILRVKIADQKMCALVENTGALRGDPDNPAPESSYVFRLGGADTEAGENDFIYYAAFNRVISGRADRTGSGVKKVTFMWSTTWPGWQIP